MQTVKGFCVVLWSLTPLLFLFCLNLYMIPHYRCTQPITEPCKPGYRAILRTKSALPYGALLTGNETQLKMDLVQDFTKTNAFHSSADVKGKYLLRPAKQDEPLSADSLGSVNDVIAKLPSGTSVIPISRGSATGLTGELTVRLLPKLGTDQKKVSLREDLLKARCAILAKDHKMLAVLDVPSSKDFVYLAIKDTPEGDWSKCYAVIEPKDLTPLIVVR